MEGQGRREVDWALVEEELAGIDPSWKDPRFDTLPHVVEVLTCHDPKAALDELRKQRDAIDVLVDDVISIYYVGFNKAIHNYSQILSLISESAEQMTGLKDSLGEARRLLGNRHKQLQQLWFRSIMLRHIITLIDQIDAMSKVPSRIEKLIKEGKLYAAVQLHLQSLASLEREGISSVGGLRDVRHELSSLRGQLFIRAVDDLQLHLYGKGQYSPKMDAAAAAAAAQPEVDDNDISSIVPVAVPATGPLHPSLAAQGIPAPSARPSTTKYSRGRSVRGRAADGKGSGLSIDTSSGAGPDEEGTQSEGGTQSQSPRSENSGTASLQGTQSEGTLASVRKTPPPIPEWLEEATTDEFIDSIVAMSAPPHVKYLHTMVECLALLGKVAAGGTILSQRVRGSIKDLIVGEIRECAAAAEAARPRVEQVTKQRHVAASPSTGGPNAGVPHPGTPVASTPAPMTPATFGTHVPPTPMGFAGGAASLSAAAGAASGTAGFAASGLEEKKGVMHDPNGPSQVAAQDLLESVTKKLTVVLGFHVLVAELMESKASTVPVKAQSSTGEQGEVAKFSASTGGYSTPFVWSCIQTECQQLLCDILKANADGTSAEASSRIQKMKVSTSGVQSELRFSFRFADASSGLGPGAAPGSSAPSSAAPLGFSSRLGSGFGSMGAGAHSASAAANAAGADRGFGTAAMLPDRGIYLTSACYRPTLQFTEKVSQMLPKQYSDLSRVGLRTFIDAFVKDQFLPTVRADYRAQAAEALSSPSAFRPKARNIGVYEPTLERGRPVLQGPLAVEALAQEVLKWAVAMPVYASELVALIQALIERCLERCRAVYTECVLGSFSSTLVGRPDLDGLMAHQASTVLLDPVDALGRQEIEAAKEEPHPDSEAYDLDMEIYQKLFSFCPLREDQLIMDAGKLVALAALSDTLEYIGEAVLRLGKTPPNQQQQQQPPPKQALTPGLQALSERCQGLAREALRTLRLEMQLQCIFHLQFMSHRSYINDVDAEEPEDFTVALTSQMTRVDEEVSVYVAPPRRYYIFGGVCGLAAYGVIRALGGLEGINSLGVRQVQRNCIALQQTLSTLNANSNQSVQLSFDRVAEYYELLNRPFEALMAYIKDHSRYFSPEEYKALLQANVPGRPIPADALSQLDSLLQYA